MTNEEKELLLKDLCSRLPYGVITKNFRNNVDVPAHMLPHVNGIKLLIAEYGLKPYLRPMSSMTEREKEEFCNIINEECGCDGIYLIGNEGGYIIPYSWMNKCVDWLNKKMFDYRGLIPKGLALEAPEDMYNN